MLKNLTKAITQFCRNPKFVTMNSLSSMPSPSSLFSAYASMAGSMMLVRSMANDLIPRPIRDYLFKNLAQFFMPQSNKLTLVIEEQNNIGRNQVYDASEVYLGKKIGPHAHRLKVIKSPRDKTISTRLEKGERIDDSFEGINLTWKLIFESENNGSNDRSRTEKRYFELSFDKKHKEKVLSSYLHWVLDEAKAIKDAEKVVKLCTLGKSYSHGSHSWNSINFEHPSTFETLAMDPDQKKAIIEDLDRFVKRKEFYKKVGRAWKRGYLLYGPPGTGKSSLIAAMANYLKFDVYDLQLGNLISDSDLRRLLLGTANRSILVIEDIDCSVELQERGNGDGRVQPDVQSRSTKGKSKKGVVLSPSDSSCTEVSSPLQLTLSGLLNFIDGLWSTCGDERIIIFTTNHKERLDPALLRPGRMDMHIHMSYCTTQGFKVLASNYLGISENHKLYGEIEGLLENAEVTPAEVAEELMKSDDAKVALGELAKLLNAKLLKRKAIDDDEVKDDAATKVGFVEAKRQKIENKKKPSVRNFRKRVARRRNL